MKKLIILFVIAGCVTFISNSNEYVEIPSTSIRMRVIASDDTDKSQNEKKIVKSFVEEVLYDTIGKTKDEKTVDNAITSQKSLIDDKIKEKMKNAGIYERFSSSYGQNYFPEKEFKGLTYKAGNYKSYVVTLGEGKGENWWCVLYPPLCLIDEQKDDYEYHYLIKDTIDKYN